ncbi:neprilysin-1-like [Ornithodoros turicata]|uniref:neprilysin-1-like n=1 Tax=Ornithodoros turicata TaxID=34597 RepID=UPI003139F38B
MAGSLLHDAASRVENRQACGDHFFPEAATMTDSEKIGRAANNSGALIKRHAWTAFTFVAVVLLVCLLGLCLHLGRRLTKGRWTEPWSPCQTPACRVYGQMLNDTVNLSLDPCRDFYKHVCDGWNRRHADSVRDALFDNVLREMIKVIHNVTVPEGGQTAVEKAARFFQSCEASVLDGKDELEQLKTFMREQQVLWPGVSQPADPVSTVFRLSLFMSTVFDVETLLTDDSAFVMIKPSSRFKTLYQRRQQILSTGTYEVFFNMHVSAFEEKNRAFMTFPVLIRVENKVTERLHNAFPSKSEDGLVMSPKHLANLSSIYSEKKWHDVILKGLHLPRGNASLYLVVSNVAYFTEFLKLAQDIGEGAMEFYVGWCFAQMSSLYVNQRFATAAFGDAALARNLQRKECLLHVSSFMGWAVVAPAMRAHFPGRLQERIVDLFRNISQRFREDIAPFSWLRIHYPSVFKNMDRREEFLKYFGNFRDASDNVITMQDLDEYYDEFGDMETSFVANWVNAAHALRESKRKIREFSFLHETFMNAEGYIVVRTSTFAVLPQSILPPFYSLDAPTSIKYGGLGSILSYGLSGVAVSLSRATGKVSDAEYASMEACLPESPVAQRTFNMWFAFNAVWKAFQDTRSAKDMRLAGFRNYSESQVFFAWWCYGFCGNNVPHAASLCNDVLGATEQFSDAFECAKGSPMNPEKKCLVNTMEK